MVQYMVCLILAGWKRQTFPVGLTRCLYLVLNEDQLVSGKVLVTFDGHHSHTNLQLVKRAKERGIHFICLPPNTTTPSSLWM